MDSLFEEFLYGEQYNEYVKIKTFIKEHGKDADEDILYHMMLDEDLKKLIKRDNDRLFKVITKYPDIINDIVNDKILRKLLIFPSDEIVRFCLQKYPSLCDFFIKQEDTKDTVCMRYSGKLIEAYRSSDFFIREHIIDNNDIESFDLLYEHGLISAIDAEKWVMIAFNYEFRNFVIHIIETCKVNINNLVDKLLEGDEDKIDNALFIIEHFDISRDIKIKCKYFKELDKDIIEFIMEKEKCTFTFYN